MRSILLFLLFFQICIPQVFADDNCENSAYILGGGGDPKGVTTTFDDEIKMMGKFFKSSKWCTSVSFNGGHQETEKILKNNFINTSTVTNFDEKNYNKSIDEMISKIKIGQLKTGDQLMVTINTHGARNNGEKTHQVILSKDEATDLEDSKGSRTANLDRLEELASLASEKGVKLALIDLSCFSGNLLNIKNNKVCIISSTGPDQYGYSGGRTNYSLFGLSIFSKPADAFISKFISLFKSGSNLEDMFLEARVAGNDADFPMISTDEGNVVNEAIYNLLSPYLRFDAKMGDRFAVDFTKFYMRENELETRICSLNQNHATLKKLLLQYESIAGINNILVKDEFIDLRKKLEIYRDFQVKYENDLLSKIEVDKEIKSILQNNFSSEENLWKDYDPSSFVNFDMSETIKKMENSKEKESTERLKLLLEEMRGKQRIAIAVRDKLTENSKKALESYSKYDLFNNSTKQMAKDISVAAKKVFSSLYKNLQDKNKSNPCRDFIL